MKPAGASCRLDHRWLHNRFNPYQESVQMANNLADKVTQKAWPALASAALRVAFGIIWVINAAFVWSPRFACNYVGYLHNAADGRPRSEERRVGQARSPHGGTARARRRPG